MGVYLPRRQLNHPREFGNAGSSVLSRPLLGSAQPDQRFPIQVQIPFHRNHPLVNDINVDLAIINLAH